MNSILHKLNQESIWNEYLEYKLEKSHLNKEERNDLTKFIESRKYEDTVNRILNGESLSIPEKVFINKLGSGKKRVVYSFNAEENYVLKLISYLLYKYDDKQPLNCFSFRKGYGAHRAIYKMTAIHNISEMWCYKLDIHDYFNSVSIPIMLPIINGVIDDDQQLCNFLKLLLTEDKAYYEGNLIEEKRGIMAGIPVSAFLANIYLKEMDEYFLDIPYARYSDDIIIFAETEDKLLEYKGIILSFLDKYELKINPKKEKTVGPNEAWDFLGVEYRSGKIDLSAASRDKLKGKIKRKARALRRWMIRKSVSEEQAMKTMIKIFNRKFFEDSGKHDLTWSRWFFPILNVTEGLKEIDIYLQQYIRYIASGCHSKKNYKVKYDDLKKLGYRSLVNEYYKARKLKQIN